MNIERTISIRKRINIGEGVVIPAHGTVNGKTESMRLHSRDISCTISIDVPVLTELPAQTFDQFVAAYCVTHGWDAFALSEAQVLEARREAWFAYCERHAWLRELGLGPDDEIGLLARLLPVGCKFRMPADLEPVYRCARMTDGQTCGFSEMHYTTVEDETPVVVRVRDIIVGYEARSK
jgi:hypothetical protein